MIFKRISLIIAFVFLSAGMLKGQSPIISDPQSIISDILEDIIALSDDENLDLEAITDDLIYFSENPINLNNTNKEELAKLIFLSDFQAIALLDYIETYGKILTIYELQLVMGFDVSDIVKLMPFVTLSETQKQSVYGSLFKYGKHDMFVRARSLIETPFGYTPPTSPTSNRYAGNKLGLYTRYSYRTRSGLQFGFVGEKDPGEEFFRGSNPYGFDHNSFHLQANNIGLIKTLVVGDFNAEFGQGLTLWTSASFGKSSDPMGVRKRPRGLVRFSSVQR